MQKIKKYFPLITGLVILLSVAAYGTRAYFSDSTKQETGIELKLGTIDVISNIKENWSYSSESKSISNPEEDIKNNQYFYTNVKPGDTFTKVLTFENKSSLAAEFSVKENIREAAEGPFLVSLEVIGANDGTKDISKEELDKYSFDQIAKSGHTLKGKESAQVELTVQVKDDSEEGDINQYNRQTESNLNIDDEKFMLDLLDNYIEVTTSEATN